MGYLTIYSGEIEFSDKKVIKKVIKEFGDYNLEIENNRLKISEEWKDYDDEMSKMCLFVALLDNQANGTIECFGDERDDNWLIIVRDGKVYHQRGIIKYENEEVFEDIGIKKKVFKITRNESLGHELVLNELKEEEKW